MPPRTQPAPHTPRLETPSRTLACAWIADLPSWALQRLEPKLRDQPVVVLEGRRAVGVCERARRAGVKRGDAVDRVRTLCPDAAIAQLEPSALSAAWDAALEAMHRVTPWIDPVRPGVAYLAGITALDAEALSSDLGVRVGVAGARGSALLAALAARGARVVKDDAAFLSRVPVYLLRGAGISGEVVQRLELFGLKTLGDILLRVTARQLEAQFGKDGTLLWSFVTGGDAKPVPIYTPLSSLQSSWTFDPLALEPHDWTAVLEHLVSSVADRLGSKVAGTVTVTLGTALGESSARQVLKWYTADQKTLLNAAHRLVLEAHPGLEFERVTLALSDLLTPTPYQASLFGQLERPPVREAIKVVHQHYPDRIGRLEIVRPNAPLKERRFRFKPLDGEEPRVKRAATDAPKRSRGKR
jgi:nucleotidyltransferase/DNA polymerase involved in DNA repair